MKSENVLKYRSGSDTKQKGFQSTQHFGIFCSIRCQFTYAYVIEPVPSDRAGTIILSR